MDITVDITDVTTIVADLPKDATGKVIFTVDNKTKMQILKMVRHTLFYLTLMREFTLFMQFMVEIITTLDVKLVNNSVKPNLILL